MNQSELKEDFTVLLLIGPETRNKTSCRHTKAAPQVKSKQN